MDWRRLSKCSAAVWLVAFGVSGASGAQTFVGTVSDNMCARDHASMRMGPTDAECTLACISAHDALPVLVTSAEVYTLTGLQRVDEFAGRKVTVTGSLDDKTRTLRVDSIALDRSSR